jgi:hypothetical protein
LVVVDVRASVAVGIGFGIGIDIDPSLSLAPDGARTVPASLGDTSPCRPVADDAAGTRPWGGGTIPEIPDPSKPTRVRIGRGRSAVDHFREIV